MQKHNLVGGSTNYLTIINSMKYPVGHKTLHPCWDNATLLLRYFNLGHPVYSIKKTWKILSVY